MSMSGFPFVNDKSEASGDSKFLWVWATNA
jgi:hypothetical protein